MTCVMPSTSMPRAAMSVATRTAACAGLEAVERALARRPATCCRGWRRRAMPALSSCSATRLAPCLVRVKTSARLDAVGASRTVSRSARLSRFATKMHASARSSRPWSPRRHRDATGSMQDASRELGDVRRHRRREEQRLALARQLAMMRRTSWMKPMSSMRSASSRTKISTSRRASRSPAPSGRAGGRAWRRGCRRRCASARFLVAWPTPPKITALVEPQVPAVGREALADLRGELARRREDERAALAAAVLRRRAARRCEDRQRERGRLAGAGLGAAEQVAAREHVRDRLRSGSASASRSPRRRRRGGAARRGRGRRRRRPRRARSGDAGGSGATWVARL